MNKTFTKFSLLITIGLLSILFSTDYTFAQNPGNALDFDGSNDYISVSDATALDNTNQITTVLTTVVSDVPVGWSNSRQNIVFYNGSNFFLLYTKGDGSIYYKSSSDNVTWSGESTLVSDQHSTTLAFDIFLVNDSKLDLAYAQTDNLVWALTATISGTTITAGSASQTSDQTAADNISIVRSGSADRVYVGFVKTTGTGDSERADQTGDITGSTTWVYHGWTNVIDQTFVPYEDSDQILAIYTVDAGGTNNDGVFSRIKTTTVSGPSQLDNFNNVPDISNAVRISDTDFRVMVRPIAADIEEWKFDGTAWSFVDWNTSNSSPSLFYDRISGDMYMFSIGFGTDDVMRHKKPSGGSWETPVVADDGEANTHSFPITQMHEPPYGSSRTDPRQLVWAYRVQNGANFDLKVGSIGSAPLPVELVSFIGKVKDQKVYLNWSTATEVNNYGFEVQRSIQTGKWDLLGFVEGHGNSNSVKEYSFIDAEVNSSGIYYYRLKQIDNDGSYEFSKTIEVNFNVPSNFELSQNYPNPFNPSTTISFNLPKSGVATLKVYNLMGEEIKTLVEGYREAGIYAVKFKAEELASGMYLYRLSSNGFTETKKMLFMK